MCFSAGASFTAGAVLSAISAVTLKQVKERKQIPFAAIPLLFAIQQFSEGILWLTIDKPDYLAWQVTATYFFLAFAQVVWPLWVPLAIMLIEENPVRKKILSVLCVVGILFSGLLGWCLVTHSSDFSLDCYHIKYDLHFPLYAVQLSVVLYPLCTIVPGLVSGIRNVRWLGVALAASLAVTELFYTRVVISVWCFFAAILSIMVYFIVKRMKPAPQKN